MIIRNAKELLTLKGSNEARSRKEMDDLAIINNGTIVINDKKIIWVGNDNELPNMYESENIIDAKNKVVMPGFVDPHTHPVFKNTRENEFEMRILGKTYVEISKAGGGINSSIVGVRESSKEELFDLAKMRIEKMIKLGTTTIEAKSGYGLDTENEIKMLEVIQKLDETLPIDIVPTFMGAHEFPPEYKNDKNEYIRILNEEMMPLVKEKGLAKYVDIFTEDHVYNIEQSRKILSTAKSLGFKLRMHADEIVSIGGADLAAELGAISADHLGAASDEGLMKMAEKKVIATLLPGTIFSLGLPNYAQARKMIDLGIPVALATDYNPGSCNCDDMSMIISLACIQMKMTPAEAIVASTFNGACALEMQDEIGSLEIGKFADIIILNIPSYQFIPYHLGSTNIETVLKKGQKIN